MIGDSHTFRLPVACAGDSTLSYRLRICTSGLLMIAMIDNPGAPNVDFV